MKQTKPFYKNKRWINKRNIILRRDEYTCQESKRYGPGIQGDTVHHIFPLDTYPELAYVNWNLICMSNKYHNKMHDRLTNEITALGEKWQKSRETEFKNKFGSPPTYKF